MLLAVATFEECCPRGGMSVVALCEPTKSGGVALCDPTAKAGGVEPSGCIKALGLLLNLASVVVDGDEMGGPVL